MIRDNDNAGQQSFNDDPEQDLRIENELLKIKMQAERGAYFSEIAEDLPPEVEAEFLKNIQLFEDSFDNAEEVTIYECIGKPSFQELSELTPQEIESATGRLLELMHSKNIVLDVQGQYEHAVIYKFITDELFHEKIREINIPGFMRHFIYEEFHPNHSLDIGNAAQQFLNDWFEKGFNEYSPELAYQFVTPEGKIHSREDVLTRLNNCLASYKRFTNIKFKESDIRFDWDEKESRGIGHAEGEFSYDAEIESGEIIHIEGPYMLYMMNEFGLWTIFYFLFPGFSW